MFLHAILCRYAVCLELIAWQNLLMNFNWNFQKTFQN